MKLVERNLRLKNIQKLFVFILVFIAFTIIGTVSHEMGHILVARALGYPTLLHFASMEVVGEVKSEFHNFLIFFGGPIQTMFTGVLGYCLLLRATKLQIHFTKTHFLWFFLTLFWLRPIFNLLNRLLSGILSDSGVYFGGDEAGLSQYLGLHYGFLSILFGIIGIIICLHSFFFLVERKNRVVLIASGIIGSALGFWIWMVELGPKIWP